MKDQQIINKIKALKMITPRSTWVSLNRDFLLRQIAADQPAVPVRLSVRALIEATVGSFSRQVFQPAVVMLLLVSVSLGGSLVANAAFYSLPGDSLYGVKIALEKTQLAVTPTDERKAELKVAFAQNRVKEFNKIVAQTDVTPAVKQERINQVVSEFQKNVVAVKGHINKIAENTDPLDEEAKAHTLRIALNLSSETQELAKSLDEKTSGLSEAEKVGVEAIVAQAVESAQATSLSAQELVEGSQPGAGASTSTEAITDPEATEAADGQTFGETETSTPAFSAPLITEPKADTAQPDAAAGEAN